MEHVKESLNQYNDVNFFNKLFEEEMKEIESQEGSEELDDKDKKRLAAELSRQGQAVMKKVRNNWKLFLKNAGKEMPKYKEFWAQQKNVAEMIKQTGLFYQLFDSPYIVGVIKNATGNAELVVYNNGSEETFISKDAEVIKNFNEFWKGEVENTMKNVIVQHKEAVAQKKIEVKKAKAEAIKAQKKAKLDAFLGDK